MVSFLLEIYSEEIPHDMQAKLNVNMEQLIQSKFKEYNIKYDSIKIYTTPIRLICDIRGLPMETGEISVEKKGPPVSATDDIINKFLVYNGITIKDCIVKNNGKGDFYFYNDITKPKPINDFIKDFIINDILVNINFKKSMRWNTSTTTWARPIRNILAIVENDNNISHIDLNLKHIKSTNMVVGNKFNFESMEISSIDQYYDYLNKCGIIFNHEERRLNILQQIDHIANSHNAKAHIPSNLLEELTYLVEAPIAIVGEIPSKYLVLPSELLINTIVKNQRYVVLLNQGSLCEKFIIITNFIDKSHHINVINGNQKVLIARLQDALFFYKQDEARGLVDRVEDLRKINYFEGLGSIWDKKERVKSLYHLIFNENQDDLCDIYKTDLTTSIVFEFPELQGIMGYYYAISQSHGKEIATAIKDSYKPQGLNDDIPTSTMGAKLSIVDKLDSIISFFSINKKPTGSKDPFALRRSAIGIIRIIHKYKFDINFNDFCNSDVVEFISDRLYTYLDGMNIYNNQMIKNIIKSNNKFNIAHIIDDVEFFHKLLMHSNINDVLSTYKRISNMFKDFDPYIDAYNIDAFNTISGKTKEDTNLEMSICMLKDFSNATHDMFLNNTEYSKNICHICDKVNNLLNNVSIDKSTEDLKKYRLSMLFQVFKHLDFLKVVLPAVS